MNTLPQLEADPESTEKWPDPDWPHQDGENVLVTTKFAPPKLNAGAITRERLLQKAAPFARGKLLLLTARSGFGKTTFMTQLRQKLISSGDTVIWITLGSGDQNWIYSWTHFVAAFRAAGFLIDDNEFSYEDPQQVRAVLLLIVEAIAEHAGDVYLFIDDFHNADSDAQNVIQRLTDLSTENFHVAISSREVTSFPLGKLRSADKIVEIHEELKFDLNESRLLLQNQLGADFSEEKIRLIHDECGGWPVSLHLIAHALKHRTRGELATQDFIHRTGSLRSYINRQVFARMPEQVLSVWQKLSICPRFNIDLACTLAEPADHQTVTSIIKNDQLLLSAVDLNDTAPSFRFSPLFSEMLRERLLRVDPGIVPTLHMKAAKWFADHGYVLEAIHYARQSPGSTQLEALLDQLPIDLRSLRWVDAIRDMLSDVDPGTFRSNRAKVIASWALFAGGSFRRGEFWAEQVISEDPGDDQDFALHQRALRATLAFFRDDSQEFFRIFQTLPPDTLHASILRHGLTTQAMTFLNVLGRYAEVRSFVTATISPGEVNDEWALIIQAMAAVSYINEGDIHEGLEQLKLIMERATASHGDRSTAVTFCATYIAESLFELGRSGEAYQMQSGRDVMSRRLSSDPFTTFSIIKSRIIRERSGAREAATYLDVQIAHSLSVYGPRSGAALLAEAVTLKLRSQGASAAEPYHAELRALAAAAGGKEGVYTEILGLEREAQGRIWLRAAEYDAADKAFEQAYEFARGLNQLRSQLRLNLLRAVACYGKKDMEATDALLVWSIETSQQLGIVRTFQGELTEVGNVISMRAPHLKISSTTRAYLDTLCATCGSSSRTPNRREVKSEDIFTKREIEIIGLLADAMSNKRIALTLGISPATVKWNLQNIFQKLGVASRYEVITWARKNLPGTRQRD